MKIMRFVYQGESSYGVVREDSLRKIEGWPSGPYKIADETIPVNEVKILAPLMPSKIVAVGLNYASHVTEMKSRSQSPCRPALIPEAPHDHHRSGGGDLLS